MTDQKPTGVFVRLPLSNEQLGKLLAPTGPLNERLLAIGMPVQDSGLTCIGNIVWFENDREPVLGPYVPAVFKKGAGVPVVSLLEAQAQIAARDAEIVRLLELLASRKRENFNAGYLIACCNIFNMHNEEGIAADILREAGISETEVKALDLNEYDAEALVVIRSASNDDPILKGGAA